MHKQASRLGDRIMNESFLDRCNFILDDRAHVFNGVIVRSKVYDHDAWCVVCAWDVNISAASVYDVKRHIKSKLHEKNAKFTV